MNTLGLHATRARTAPNWLQPAGMLLLLALALWSSRFSDLDLRLTQAFFDPVTQRFPWREQWLAAAVLHDAARWVSAALVLLLLALVAAGSWSARPRWRALRGAAAYTLLSAVLSAWLVSTLKHQSQHSCPWDLSLFGGSFDYFRLLAPLPAHPGPGQCLPSGHASTGFMWIGALYAAARWPHAPWNGLRGWRVAWAAFALATSLVQVARGAHFLSHVLIAAAVCWATAWLCDRLLALRTGLKPAWAPTSA